MFTTTEQFFTDFRIKNGQFPNETVLNRGPMRLKREINELKSLVDALMGKKLEPWHEDKVYEIDEYVSYNGIIYKSNLDSNVAMNPQSSGFWDQQNIESVKSKNQVFKYIEHISDGTTRKYETPFQMSTTPAVFVDGKLLSPSKFSFASNYIELNNPAGNLKPVTIIAGLTYESVTVQPRQTFIAEEDQYHFEVGFQLSSPAVFVNGLYTTTGFIFGSNYVDFDDHLKAGTVVSIVNGSLGGLDVYSRSELNEILSHYYPKNDLYNKDEVDSSLLNTKNLILTDETLAKSNNVYTKTEVDSKFANIDVTDQVKDALYTKADKASSLAGYGIENAYDKDTVDLRLQEKLNVAEFNGVNILSKIRNVEGNDTGLNADTLKGLKPEQFVRRDRADHVTDTLTVKSKTKKLVLSSHDGISEVVSVDDDHTASYDALTELNSKNSIVVIEGDFKGTWYDYISNAGVDPSLYNWSVQVTSLFVGSKFDFVPKTYGDGFLYKAWSEDGSSGSFTYGYIDNDVLKVYSWIKLLDGSFQAAPAHYVLTGIKKHLSSRITRNQGDPGNPIKIPNIKDDNALKLISGILHEADNKDNLIQSSKRKFNTLYTESNEYIEENVDYFVRIRGGVPNASVKVSIVNGSIVKNAVKFNDQGEAFILVRGVSPLDYPPVITIDSPRCKTITLEPKIKGKK